ncbi:hypothetical protein BJ741DRAFT_15725 [Chytriomyces cf. hyalinus JEL632]|nr:hypothetical protein BJ741DRAFT_15725 [Chytriomyces cf. hyalinus JEL632]
MQVAVQVGEGWRLTDGDPAGIALMNLTPQISQASDSRSVEHATSHRSMCEFTRDSGLSPALTLRITPNSPVPSLLSLSCLRILSSARAVEVYADDEYMGTAGDAVSTEQDGIWETTTCNFEPHSVRSFEFKFLSLPRDKKDVVFVDAILMNLVLQPAGNVMAAMKSSQGPLSQTAENQEQGQHALMQALVSSIGGQSALLKDLDLPARFADMNIAESSAQAADPNSYQRADIDAKFEKLEKDILSYVDSRIRNLELETWARIERIESVILAKNSRETE